MNIALSGLRTVGNFSYIHSYIVIVLYLYKVYINTIYVYNLLCNKCIILLILSVIYCIINIIVYYIISICTA